jgi:mRNA interferase RelE/StbE
VRFPVTLLWARRATRSLQRLNQPTQEHIIDRVEQCARTGNGDFTRLRGVPDGYRLRVGDWRVLFEFDSSEGVLRVVAVASRGSAYRR